MAVTPRGEAGNPRPGLFWGPRGAQATPRRLLVLLSLRLGLFYLFVFPALAASLSFYSLAGGPAACGVLERVPRRGSHGGWCRQSCLQAACLSSPGHQPPRILPSARKRRVGAALHLPWGRDVSSSPAPGPSWLSGYPTPTSGTEGGCPRPGWWEDGGVTPCRLRGEQRGSHGWVLGARWCRRTTLLMGVLGDPTVSLHWWVQTHLPPPRQARQNRKSSSSGTRLSPWDREEPPALGSCQGLVISSKDVSELLGAGRGR